MKLITVRLAALLVCLGIVCLSFTENIWPDKTAHAEYARRKVQVINLDKARTGQVFEGIGSVFSYEKLFYDYPEKQRNELLDYLFLPGYGAALQILKVEIGYDGNNTATAWPAHRRSLSEPPNYTRGFVWWLMKEAKKRNPDIILSALHWGYPAYAVNDSLKADFIFSFVDGAKKVHNLDITYIGGNQNESVITPEVTILLRKLLNEHGYQHVRIVAADEGARVKRFDVLRHLQENKPYADAVDVIGVHYKGRPASFLPKQAITLGKDLWSSEDGGGSYTNVNSGYHFAHQLYKLFYQLPFNAVAGWLATASAYDNMPWPHAGFIKAKEPWSGYYEVSPHTWAIAHYTQFTKPGWRVLRPVDGSLYTDGKICGNFLAFADTNRSNYTVVFNTYSANFPDTGMETVLRASALQGKSIQVWKSDFTKSEDAWFIQQQSLKAVDGIYRLRLAKNCLYTLSSLSGRQGKGGALPPKNHPFSLPYTDSFDQYNVGAMPRYFVDANGAFEIEQATDKQRGMVLKQVIKKAPRLWHWRSLPPAQPVTQMGNMEWKDYQVNTDVLLEGAGTFCLAGRFDGKKESSGDYLMEGYWLFINEKGGWKIVRRDAGSGEKHIHDLVPLAMGTYRGIKAGKWFTLTLKFKGSKITAYCNSEVLAQVEDNTYNNGCVALATLYPGAASFFAATADYTAVKLDNFQVKPVE